MSHEAQEPIDFSFTEIARPSNDDVRRTTLQQIRTGQLRASVTTAAGIKRDAKALKMYEQYECDLKTLLVALEQRDTYKTLYTELLKERDAAQAAAAAIPP
ncbi:hypothetical protein AURDEDRAFT_164145 [Auricularia subglabra TFB-10046 SS5]|nr:hypothetical protein AURDEDRAFT_164145 [Auricularia subglabra TFB-10046 SS5]